jgi:hypothetical protein
MADWSLPTLTSIYTNTLTEIKNRDIDLALQFDGTTSTSIPTGAIRWTSSANTWQKWTGSAWGALSSTFAFPAITTTGAATIGTTLGVTGVTTLSGGGTSTTAATDNNSTAIATTAFVVGQASATAPVMAGTAAVGSSFRYARQDHVHPTDTTRAPLASPTFTGSVTIPAGASISGYAPLASPTFTGTVTIPAGASISGYAPLASPSFTGTANFAGNVGFGGVTPVTKIDLSGNYSQNIVSVAALNIDCSAGNYFTKTISANSTFTVSNVPSGRSYSFTLELTYTGGTINWFANLEWPVSLAPTLNTGRTHLLMFITDDGGARWRGASIVDYAN